MPAVAAPPPSTPPATPASLEAVVDPMPSAEPAEVDVVVTLVPETWHAAQLVRAVGRRRDLLTGVVVVGWCGVRELRLVHGRDSGRLAPVVDLLARALRPADRGAARCLPLTLTDVPDGARLFDELATGRRVVVAEVVVSGPEAVHRWLRMLAATAARAPDAETTRRASTDCGTGPGTRRTS